MTPISLTQDKNYLQNEQYKDAHNLNARINLHQQFSTTKIPWTTWVYDHLALQPRMKILECGCGSALLWHDNLARIPANCQITLTDLSEGMVAAAQESLANTPTKFQFKTANIQQLPFDDDTFDIIIANHMLYHVPNLPQALSEVRRVLQENGRFYAATNGKKHLQEMRDLIPENIPQPALQRLRKNRSQQWKSTFSLENGAEQLATTFAHIKVAHFADSLEITEAAPLTAYILSTLHIVDATPEIKTELQQQIAPKIAQEGSIHISKDSGLFIAS